MGRVTKMRTVRKAEAAETPAAVQLEELDYLRLTLLRGNIHEAKLRGDAEVRQAQGVAQQRVAGTEQALVEALIKLSPKYGISLTTRYEFDDTRHRLVPQV